MGVSVENNELVIRCGQETGYELALGWARMIAAMLASSDDDLVRENRFLMAILLDLLLPPEL